MRHALREKLRAGSSLPVIAAPMLRVVGPELVTAACVSGIASVLPALNAPDLDTFRSWLLAIQRARTSTPAPGTLMVNLPANLDPSSTTDIVRSSVSAGVEVFVSVGGDPQHVTQVVHDHGGQILHDVVTLRHARNAIRAGVDGLICISAGGGGHSGTLSPFVFIPAIRREYDGVIVAAGAVAEGSAVRASLMLGADLAYIGTRFIATRESRANSDYKRMLIASTSVDLTYTGSITGIPANWLTRSLQEHGLTGEALEAKPSAGDYSHLPPDARPWRTVWSAGQGVEFIDDNPSVAEVVDSLEMEYLRASRAEQVPVLE